MCFAGDWQCIAVLLDRPVSGGTYTPKWVGLTRRNIGIIKRQDKEVRVGMRIFSWNAMQPFQNTHPRLAVARGSHALYLPDEVPEVIAPLTSVDPSRGSCGLAEPPAATIISSPLAPQPGLVFGVMVVPKVVAGATVGVLGGPFGVIAGALAGLIWTIVETATDPDRLSPQVIPPASPDPPKDVVNTASGTVVCPAGLRPPEVGPDRAVQWRSKDNLVLDNRRYDSSVDRDTQKLWPDDVDPAVHGYTGRWGPRVENRVKNVDQTRRAGMRFPNFWRMFFEALVQSNPQSAIAQTVGTPIGNATNNGGLAAAYDGNFDKTWVNSPTGDSADGVFIGKSYPTAYHFSGIRIRLSSDLGFNGNDNAARTCTVFGKSGANPTTPTDGDQLFVFTVMDTARFDQVFLVGFKTATHDRVWVTLDNPQGDGVSVFTQVVWYATT